VFRTNCGVEKVGLHVDCSRLQRNFNAEVAALRDAGWTVSYWRARARTWPAEAV